MSRKRKDAALATVPTEILDQFVRDGPMLPFVVAGWLIAWAIAHFPR